MTKFEIATAMRNIAAEIDPFSPHGSRTNLRNLADAVDSLFDSPSVSNVILSEDRHRELLFAERQLAIANRELADFRAEALDEQPGCSHTITIGMSRFSGLVVKEAHWDSHQNGSGIPEYPPGSITVTKERHDELLELEGFANMRKAEDDEERRIARSAPVITLDAAQGTKLILIVEGGSVSIKGQAEGDGNPYKVRV